MPDHFFFQAFVYLTAAVISVPIAKRLGLGSVLGYLLAGIAIGPYALGLIGEEGEDVMHFAEFGVVMMLFLVGLELKPSLLWRLRGPILGLGGLQMVFTAGAGMAIALAFGLDWQPALAVGLILAGSSTAIALQTLNEKSLMKTDAGQSAFSVLLFQDIAVIPILALLPLLAVAGVEHGGAEHGSGHGAAWIDGLPGWAHTLVVLGAVVGIVFVGRFLMRPIFRFIAAARLRELFTAAALLLVIATALLMTLVGLSAALGAFVAGVVLADSEYRHELEGDIEPFKGLLLGLFFIAVGASIDFALIAANPGLIAALVGMLLAVKLVVLLVLGRAFRMGLDQNLLFAFTLAQGGEFAFVLFSFATGNGVLTTQVASPLVAVVALSMAATPLLMVFAEKLLLPRVGTREKDTREADDLHGETPVIIAGFGRFGNICGRLLRANGIEATVLDLDSDNVEALRRVGFQVYYGDASRLDLLLSAGATQARLLILAIDEHERALEMVHTATKHFPRLQIMARAAGRIEAYELLDAGVEHVYRETLDTSLRVGVDAMRILGFRANQAFRASRMFRVHDENCLRELASMRHDRKAYIRRVRERIADLETLLAEDRETALDSDDAAWDPESLKEEILELYGEAGNA